MLKKQKLFDMQTITSSSSLSWWFKKMQLGKNCFFGTSIG